MKPFPDEPHNGPAALFVSACCRRAAAAAGILALAGCGVGGFSLEKAAVDPSLVTSSIQAPSTPDATAMDADQATIRNAVSSADIEGIAGQPIAWANPDTGSRGTITQVAEVKQAGRLCRRFAGSRERFDGVAMFRGETCTAGQGIWRIEAFKAL